jgi:hypothetical protein
MMTIDQNRQPKGTSRGGEFAPIVNAESTVVLDDTPRDETLREKDDAYLEQFAEDANNNLDNWFDKRADEDDDWNEWTMADALSFMETFESMIRARRVALQEDVNKAEMKKMKATLLEDVRRADEVRAAKGPAAS